MKIDDLDLVVGQVTVHFKNEPTDAYLGMQHLRWVAAFKGGVIIITCNQIREVVRQFHGEPSRYDAAFMTPSGAVIATASGFDTPSELGYETTGAQIAVTKLWANVTQEIEKARLLAGLLAEV